MLHIPHLCPGSFLPPTEEAGSARDTVNVQCCAERRSCARISLMGCVKRDWCNDISLVAIQYFKP